MSRDQMQDLIAESRAAMDTLLRLTSRLEAFTDQLEDDLREQRGESDDGTAGPDQRRNPASRDGAADHKRC